VVSGEPVTPTGIGGERHPPVRILSAPSVLAAAFDGGGLRSRLVDTFWAQSQDGGNIFPTLLRVTSATSNWCTATSNVRPNFGDYIGSATGGNHVFPVWADGRNGVPDTFYATLQGAGKSK